MLFNSVDFAVFLPIVFLIYWSFNRQQLAWRNATIVISSYFFYGWWDWRFLLLIFLSTLVDYSVGLALNAHTRSPVRKTLLGVSIAANLGLLGVFKYFNFFIDSLESAFSFFGTSFGTTTLNIVLPVGISFYTFQTMSYTIDVYRRRLDPTRDFIGFAAFVCFFPQLVAGPIERATNLLPQFATTRTFDYSKAVDGLRQILWGLFKKIVIADNCAVFVNQVFDHPADFSGSTLALGAVMFALQIYCDFSGYSDIAIGTARLFGFDLMRNFAFPYFSRDIAEFWRRWHISLSTWFRDYVYIPLGGSRCGSWTKIRNVFTVFLVSGLWHGANWTFIVWGTLHAMFFLPLLLMKRNRNNIEIVAHGKRCPSPRDVASIGVTFGLTTFAWIFFRAESLAHAMQYIIGIFNLSIFQVPVFPATSTMALVLAFMVLEWVGREDEYAIEQVAIQWPRPARWAGYYALTLSILVFAGQEQEFMYFQF